MDDSEVETRLALPVSIEQASNRLVDPIEAPNARNPKSIKVWPNAAYFQPDPVEPIYYGAWLFQEPKEGEFRFITAPVTLSGNPKEDQQLLEEMAAQGLDVEQVQANCSEANIRRNFGS